MKDKKEGVSVLLFPAGCSLWILQQTYNMYSFILHLITQKVSVQGYVMAETKQVDIQDLSRSWSCDDFIIWSFIKKYSTPTLHGHKEKLEHTTWVILIKCSLFEWVCQMQLASLVWVNSLFQYLQLCRLRSPLFRHPHFNIKGDFVHLLNS